MSTNSNTTGALVGRERIDVTAFCIRERITANASRTDRNPNMDDSANMDHWKVVLSRAGHRNTITVLFSMGLGHNGKAPKADDVLNCLASDYTEENASFEDWCAEFGYDTDSRKAERTFRVCQKQTAMLEHFLGAELTNELVYEVERL